MKHYKFELIISVGHDETWTTPIKNGKSGCDEIKLFLLDMLNETGIENFNLELIEYKNDRG